MKPVNYVLGICPICDREMWEGHSTNRHHFYPKCKGGKESEFLHRICHRKIHSLFSEKQLAKTYNNTEIIRENEEIQKFIKWVSKKEPDFYDGSKNSYKIYKINY
jgi:hypothetical protein